MISWKNFQDQGVFTAPAFSAPHRTEEDPSGGGFVFPPFFAGSSPFFPKRGRKFPRFGGNFSPVSSIQGKGNPRKIPAKNGQKRRKTIQKFRICAAAAALALLCAAPVSAAELPAEEGIRTVNAARQGSFRFDFSRDGEGFSPLIADYPVGSETFYELEVSRQAIPIDGAGCRLWLTGNNHSDDLFLGVSRCLEGLPAGLPCVFTVRVRIATNVDGGLIGIGGSPGSSVFVKCGITAAEPRREAVDGSYRLTLDKGNQGQDGPDMAIVGNLEKENGQRPGQYEWKSYRCRAMAVPGQDGKVYLSFGIDSGFERLSCYYLDSVDIAWEETQPLSRGRGHPDPVGESGPSHRGGGALPRHGEGRPLCRRAPVRRAYQAPHHPRPLQKGPELLRPQRGKAGPQGRAPPRQRHPPAPLPGRGRRPQGRDAPADRAPPAQGRAGRMTTGRCASCFPSGRAIAHVFLFLKI